MNKIYTPDELIALGTAQGMTTGDICRKAGVADSIFYRWRRGESEPNLASYRALVAVVVEEKFKRGIG